MDSPATKSCSICQAVKPLTREFFFSKSDSPDSFRAECKVCTKAARSSDATREEKRLKNHKRVVAEAKKRLAHPENLSVGEIFKLDQIIRLEDERIEKLAAKVAEQRRAEEAKRIATSANPVLEAVRAKFPTTRVSLLIDDTIQLDVAAYVAEMRAALAQLTDEPAHALARRYLAAVIEGFVGTTQEEKWAAERQTKMAEAEQETLNEEVARRVIGRLQDEWLPRIKQASTKEQQALVREAIREKKKQLLTMAKDGGKDKSGADKSVVARTVAGALEKLALLCYGAKAPLVADTLVGAQSRSDIEVANYEYMERLEAERLAYWDNLRQRDPKQFELESRSLVRQIKGNDHWSKLQRDAARRLIREDPQEAIRRALLSLKPKNVEQPNIIWVLQQGRKEIWYWPWGALVKRGDGGEVVYDMRMKAYFLTPAPLGAQLESPTTKPAKLEWYADENDPNCTEDGPVWKQREEGSGGVYEQQSDGTFKRVDNPSAWTKPERVIFRKAEPPASAAHTEFRLGKFWTPEEVKAAEAADAANPSAFLPPLSQFPVADSVATPVERKPTPAEIERMNRPAYVWDRWAIKQREDKEREAALLRGEEPKV